MSYPERPPKLRPKKPRKGQGKPSSEHISGRRKSWLSVRETVDNRGNDTGARSGMPWWKSPLMKQERLNRAASRKPKNAASVDTHPKGGDAKQAPSLMGSAVGEAETPQSPPLSQGDE